VGVPLTVTVTATADELLPLDGTLPLLLQAASASAAARKIILPESTTGR